MDFLIKKEINVLIKGTVFVMRGLPGTGKSTFAKFLKELLPGLIICSTDDYFMDSKGNYNFDKEKLQEAHKQNFERFKKAIDEDVQHIVIDNTNIKAYHFYQYIDYAQRFDYRVVVITIPHNDVSDRELSERTIHGLDRGLIRKMRREFEWKMHS